MSRLSHIILAATCIADSIGPRCYRFEQVELIRMLWLQEKESRLAAEAKVRVCLHNRVCACSYDLSFSPFLAENMILLLFQVTLYPKRRCS